VIGLTLNHEGMSSDEIISEINSYSAEFDCSGQVKLATVL
jgi:hypothetical protein